MATALVLIGFAEALSSPEVAWSLVDSGFKVAAFSRRGRKSALKHSRHVTVFDITAPETDSDAAQADLAAVLSDCCANNGAEKSVLFPLDDVAVWLCAQPRMLSGLPAKWVLAGPQPSAVQLALDKSVQVKAASQAGLSVPVTTTAETRDRVLTHVEKFPLILKPAKAIIPEEGYVRKGSNWICANRSELDHALSQWREEYPLLVQPYITGIGAGVFGFAGARGVECWSAHRRLRMMNPHGSGSSACASKAVPEDLKEPIERMILTNGWRGLFMLELLQDSEGKYWFIEFNGRSWGSMALSRRQGLEYPAWNARLALDPNFSIQRSEPRGAEVVCRNLGRELMHLLFVLRGRKSKAIEKWPSFWRSVADVLFVRPRDCFYNFRRDDLRVFFSDCFCTIRGQLFKPRRRKQNA